MRILIIYLLDIPGKCQDEFDRKFLCLGGDFVTTLTSYHKKGPMNNDINTSQ